MEKEKTESNRNKLTDFFRKRFLALQTQRSHHNLGVIVLAICSYNRWWVRLTNILLLVLVELE